MSTTRSTVRISLAFVATTLVVLFGNHVWGASLSWSPNSEADLAGYRVYRCAQQPCSKSSGNTAVLATLGKVTSFNIGTPAVVQYYVITAFDFSNNESRESAVAIYTPASSTPPPPSPPSPPTPTNLRVDTVN